MVNYPQAIRDFVLDVVFPKTCLGCGKFTNVGDFGYFCKKCFGKIELKNNFECIGCKNQAKYGLTCTNCRKENSIDQLLVATNLKDAGIDKLLKTFKYSFIEELSLPLSVIARKFIKKVLSKGFNIFEDNPLLLPVPLHKRRLNWRGFNQSGLISKKIADVYHFTYNSEVLIRISNPKHQVDAKSREERLISIKNSFVITDKKLIEGKNIILFDDVCTSGATLNECAKILKENGAKIIIGFVIARG